MSLTCSDIGLSRDIAITLGISAVFDISSGVEIAGGEGDSDEILVFVGVDISGEVAISTEDSVRVGVSEASREDSGCVLLAFGLSYGIFALNTSVLLCVCSRNNCRTFNDFLGVDLLEVFC